MTPAVFARRLASACRVPALFPAVTVVALSLLAGVVVAQAQAQAVPRILAIGDSMLAAHSISGRSVARQLSRHLGVPVTDRSVAGAWMNYKLPITGALGMSIPKQFVGGDWDYVVVNGGGNDLMLGCGCNRCDRKLDKLISTSGTRGALPAAVREDPQVGGTGDLCRLSAQPGHRHPDRKLQGRG